MVEGQIKIHRKKSLYASPVGKNGKSYLQKIIERFGYDDFDYLIMIYDDLELKGKVFSDCQIVYDKSPLFFQAKKFLVPRVCQKYEYIFFWMDDIDILGFNPKNFLNIMRRFRLEVAQPALHPFSAVSHKITVCKNTTIGRYTDFVEQMVNVYRVDAWIKFWSLFSYTDNHWGWGYDLLAYDYCGFIRMGIIDAEVVLHTKKGSYHEVGMRDMKTFLERHRNYLSSNRCEICEISDNFVKGRILAPLLLHSYKLLFSLLRLLKKMLQGKFGKNLLLQFYKFWFFVFKVLKKMLSGKESLFLQAYKFWFFIYKVLKNIGELNQVKVYEERYYKMLLQIYEMIK